MIKKIFTISFLFLLIGCGFKPMLKNFDTSKLIIQKLNYIGKNELTYLLHANLGLKEKKTSGGLIVDLTINENLVSTTKSTAGIDAFLLRNSQGATIASISKRVLKEKSENAAAAKAKDEFNAQSQ